MNTSTKSHGQGNCDSDDCASGKRNRFFRGKTMKASEFSLEQRYAIERRRLVNRSVLGWGVVRGLVPELGSHTLGQRDAEGCGIASHLTVKPGLALDEHGREIVVLTPQVLSASNTIWWDDSGHGCEAKPVSQAPPGKYLLAIHYAERSMGEVSLPERCDGAETEKNFVCETVVFSLRPLGNRTCACGEPGCRKQACKSNQCAPEARRPQSALCQWTSDAEDTAKANAHLHWNGLVTYPRDAVDLACVTLDTSGDSCKPMLFASVDDNCSPRRIVKNNQLLFDLLRGCDLTRIQRVSWGKWHRNPVPMPWQTFLEKLGPKVEDPDKQLTALTDFGITFSGPVMQETVTPDCFSLRFIVTGEDTGWYEERVVPIVDLKYESTSGEGKTATTCGVKLYVPSEWQEEVRQGGSKLRDEPATVRIEVLGDYILDCNGQALDANARGFALQQTEDETLAADLSGNGSPGGTFVSVFRVASRRSKPKGATAD